MASEPRLSVNPFDEDTSALFQSLNTASARQSEKTVVFQPGPLGLTLDWATGLVKAVLPGGQGAHAEVQAGWYVHELDGFAFTREALARLSGGARPYSARFAARPWEENLVKDEQPIWEADKPACGICNTAFTLTNRRHHCRLCGKCVCKKCSPSRVRIESCVDLERACNPCIEGAGHMGRLLLVLTDIVGRLDALQARPGGGSPPPSLREAVARVQDLVPPLESRIQRLQKRADEASAKVCESDNQVETLRTLLARDTDQRRQVVVRLVSLAERLATMTCRSPGSDRAPAAADAVAAAPFDTHKALEKALETCEGLLPSLEEAQRNIHSRSLGPPESDREDEPNGRCAEEVADIAAWEPNMPACSICRRRIGKRALSRRHHCRVCGKCVCAGCSPNAVVLDERLGPQRACTPCVQAAFRAARASYQHSGTPSESVGETMV